MRLDMLHIQKDSNALYDSLPHSCTVSRQGFSCEASKVQMWELLLLFPVRPAAYLSIAKQAEGFITEEI